VQDVARAASGLLAQFFVEVLLIPALQDFRLFFRQASTHGKIGFRQKECLRIVERFGHDLTSSGHVGERRHRSWLLGARVKANNPGTAR
jgi:hypothetical protein